MTDDDKKTVILDFITSLVTQDAALLRSVAMPDIVWSLPGTSPMSGEAHGVDAIMARARTLQQYGVRLEVEHVVYGCRDVAVHLHNTGRQDGRVLDEHLTTVCTLSGDKMQRIDTFISDVPMLNAFFV
jgi:uncharacterized protein